MFQVRRADSAINIWALAGAAGALVALGLALLIWLTPDRPQSIEAIEGILRAGDPLFERYRENMRFVDPEIGLTVNFTGGRAVMFSGNFYNGADQPLDAVELELTLFNYAEPLWKTVKTALRPDSRQGPIPARRARRLSVYIEDLPEEWFGQHAEIEIHGFRVHEGETRRLNATGR